jgi:hypothetical protein
VGDAWLVLTRIGEQLAELPELLASYPFGSAQITGAMLVVLLVVIEFFDERRSIFARLAAAPVALRWGAWYAVLAALVLLGRWQAQEFIYMQF